MSASHPVVWIGKLIEALEHRWNDRSRSEAARTALGVITMTIVAGSAAAVGYAIQTSAQQLPFGILIVVLVATVGLAQRSLYTHVRDVLRPLARDDLHAAREAVSKIVGRDTTQLTASVSLPPRSKASRKASTRNRRTGFLAHIGGLPDCSRTRR